MEFSYSNIVSTLSFLASIVLFFLGWKYRKDIEVQLEYCKHSIRIREKETNDALEQDRNTFRTIKGKHNEFIRFARKMCSNPKIHNQDNFFSAFDFIEPYYSCKTITFYNEEIENAWRDFLNKSNNFLDYVSTNTFPKKVIDQTNLNEIPPEWDFKRFDEVRYKIIDLASDTISTFEKFYDKAKRILIVE